MMKNVLLIYPHCLEERLHDEDASVPPIGLFYLGAVLEAEGRRVDILNTHPVRNHPEIIEKMVAERDPDVIGFCILHANRWPGLEMARLAKRIHPGVPVVFGGIGATFLWEHFLRHFHEIDYAVVGEGELAFPELLRCLERGDKQAVGRIPGVAFREGERIVFNGAGLPVEQLDRLPDPARYFDFQHLTSSRGCPGRCTFCGSPAFWGHKVRFHSPAYFVDQIERLYRRGQRFFYVSDDTFTLRPERVIEICKGILERGLDISWAAICRVKDIHEKLLYWMRKAGCVQISYGVESGSPAIREKLGKKIGQTEIRKAFRLTQAYGILARAYFIYGCPGENADTIQATLDLMDDIKPLSTIFYILDLFPGTALYADYVQRSGVTDDIWLERMEDIMYFETVKDLRPERILEYGRTLRTGFYRRLGGYIRSIELVDLPDLYPHHADFLSRLGMTLSHGDYAGIEEIADKAGLAEFLYRRALDYHADHRAFLGLGVLLQKRGAHREAAGVLEEGTGRFPESESLNVCMGISLMNLGRYGQALPLFLKFPESVQALEYAALCYGALGERSRESDARRRAAGLQSRIS